jgi:hypothetical protein
VKHLILKLWNNFAVQHGIRLIANGNIRGVDPWDPSVQRLAMTSGPPGYFPRF